MKVLRKYSVKVMKTTNWKEPEQMEKNFDFYSVFLI